LIAILSPLQPVAEMHLQARFQQVLNAALVASTPTRHTPKWIDWHPPAAGGGRVVFVAADTDYFRRFGAGFLASLVRQDPVVTVHFHLFDPDQECLETLDRWKSQLPLAKIGYSREALPGNVLLDPKPSQAKQSWKSLYICCSRFLAAQHLQRSYGVSVIVMDIDVIFAGRPAAIFEGAQYGLMPRLAQKNWCKRTLGGVVFASSAPLGRAFLDRACLQIEKFLSLGLYWFAFDQYALYRALSYMKRRHGLAGFRALTHEHVSFDLAAQAPILYPKGRSKESDAFKALANDAMLAGRSPEEPVRCLLPQ
jgi:hypothetical protein